MKPQKFKNMPAGLLLNTMVNLRQKLINEIKLDLKDSYLPYFDTEVIVKTNVVVFSAENNSFI